jgi:hypothetical protein
MLSTTQQVGMALGVALAGVIFFNLLASGSGHGVTAVTPSLRGQLTAAAVCGRHPDRRVLQPVRALPPGPAPRRGRRAARHRASAP